MPGFIKTLTNGIVSLITGIVGFLTGLLPGKKPSNGYYLELDEAATGAKPKDVAPKTTPKLAEVSNGTKAVVAETVAKPAETTPTPKTATNGKAPKAEPANVPVAKAKPTQPTETTFAPKYLAPSASGSNGRRRPGANMSAYLELARQIKTPG